MIPKQDVKQPAETGVRQTAENRFATRLRGFGPLGIVPMILIPFAGPAFIGAILVLLWIRLSHTPWREIGYVPPKSWMRAIAIGIIFGVAFKLVMKAVVMPLLAADPINKPYHYLSGNTGATAAMAVFVIVSGGWGEETVYRGFLFERFCKLFGSGRATLWLALLLTSIWFAVVHYADQGVAGAEQAAMTGLVFGTIYVMTDSVFMPMFAHSAFDLTAVALIYWDLETRVAHFVFM